jgi:hypothetical protein
LKKTTSPKSARNLDKFLFEAGQQCQKRLWLDYHEPGEEPIGPMRQAMSEIGAQLRTLARSAFPKGVVVEGKDVAAAAADTKAKIAAGAPHSSPRASRCAATCWSSTATGCATCSRSSRARR